MNHQEFMRWFDYHRTTFPGLGRWLDGEDNVGVFRRWERALESVEYPHAVCATDALLVEEESLAYGDHIRYIRSYHARQQPLQGELACWGPQVKDGRLIAHCPRCMDFGIVSVLTPSTLQAAWRHKQNYVVGACVIACDCDRGDQIVRHRAKGKKTLVQWQEGHALIRMDDVIEVAVDLLEAGDHTDTGQAYRDAARHLLVKYHQSQKPQAMTLDEFAHQEF